MTTAEQFMEEFKNAAKESGADHQILIRNEIQFLLASRPKGWIDVGIDSPIMWIEKCGELFKGIIDENPALINEFENGDEKKHLEMLDEIGEQIEAKIKAKILH